MGQGGKTYSITLRMRRTIVQDGHVSVPLTDLITKQPEDGTHRIDTDALTREAIRLSEDPRVDWRIESSTTDCHTWQQARPEDRTTFDPYYEGPDAVC